MGRSASCFKVITCSGDDDDRDDLEALESKCSSDRRGWSFRKRSARHRVLSNTVASETPSYETKEVAESTAINVQSPAISTVPEKIPVLQLPDEKPPLLTSVDSKVSEVAIATESTHQIAANLENENDVGSLEESFAIVIQTAIRGILAQAALLKIKNLVKLQAAVRGHLVRRHAVGTLRCIQAILKMQALVRARHARVSLEVADTEEKLVRDCGKDSKPLGKNNSVKNINTRSTSIDKLLSNAFARQLLECTLKTKPIHIKCDPSRPDSAWKWLERWMSVSSSTLVGPEKPGAAFEPEQPKSEHSIVLVAAEELADMKSSANESAIQLASKERLISSDAEKSELQAAGPTSASISNTLVLPWPENTSNSNVKETSGKRDLVLDGGTQSDADSRTERSSLSAKSAVESAQSKQSMKRLAPEQLENKGKKFVSGSRKASSPTFIAAQSKFEDLSMTVDLGRPINSSNQDTEVERSLETVSPPADAASSTRESLVENCTPRNYRAQIGGSECGTELSVTSTLDSPEVSESGALEYEHEAKVSEESINNHNSRDNLSVGSQDLSANPESLSLNLLTVQPDQPGKINDVNVESGNSVKAVDPREVGQKPERSISDLQVELGLEKDRQMHKLSPEASPRSHITIPESQGTPASQVSVNAKRRKAKQNGSNTKSKSLPTGKRSSSGANSSSEQLPKDQEIGKRRSSFGSEKADNVNQEPRDSTSSNSLPSYMQPTESAKAKAHLTNSPRSSPDVQDKDIYVKKRHSLPGANGRHGSPHIQRSIVQAQQSAKGNGSHSPRERKWQR